MAWTIEFERDAIRQLNWLDKAVRERILHYLESRVAGVGGPRRFGKPLTGDRAGLWAYRIGAYRAVCLIENERLVVVVASVGHRREVYR